jgi:hypothetical protein
MNPATGDGLAFTFFDTVANLEASATQAGQLRGDAARNIGAEMCGVCHFEVEADTEQHVDRRASHARVLNFAGDPARLDEAIEMIPATPIPDRACAFGGSIGGFWLADRENGSGVRVTLFDSVTNLAASRDQAAQIRAHSDKQMPGAFSAFAEYEVVATEETPARPNAA